MTDGGARSALLPPAQQTLDSPVAKGQRFFLLCFVVVQTDLLHRIQRCLQITYKYIVEAVAWAIFYIFGSQCPSVNMELLDIPLDKERDNYSAK